MSLAELFAGLRRRWYAAVAGLLITGVLCLAALSLVPVQYQANSTILLMPPNTTVGAGGNPYLALGGLQGAADVVARAMSGAAVSDDVTPPGGSASYTFQVDATSSAPMLVIQAQDDSAAGAISTLNKLLGKAPEVLNGLQKQVGAPAKSFIKVGPITQDTVPTVIRKSQTRAIVVAGVVGLALTLFGTNLLDGYLVRRGSPTGRRKRPVEGSDRSMTHERMDPRPVPSAVAVESPNSSRTRSLRLRPTEGGPGAESTAVR